MKKMANMQNWDHDETKDVFIKLNTTIKKTMNQRKDIDYLLVNYNDILLNPKDNIRKIINFIDLEDTYLKNMIDVVDKQLHRQRRE